MSDYKRLGPELEAMVDAELRYQRSIGNDPEKRPDGCSCEYMGGIGWKICRTCADLMHEYTTSGI
jgi:hypothetical protein